MKPFSSPSDEEENILKDDDATSDGYGSTSVGEPRPQDTHQTFFDFKWYRKEAWEILWLAGPLIICMMLQFLITPISLMFCGRLNEMEFGAASLANTIILVTGIYIGNGLTTACDTLFSQIFGAGNNKEIGIVLQRAMLIMLICCLPCWALHLNAESLLHLLGQEKEVCRLTGIYLKVFIPGLPANFIYQVLAKYLQNQNVVTPVIGVLFIGNITNAISQYLLVFQAELHLIGSSLAQVFAQYSLLISISLYIYISRFYQATWNGWSWLAFADWFNFVRYAIPGMIMVVLDSLCFEIGTFAAGLFGVVVLGAQTTINQIDAIFYQFLQGTAIACSIRVGQHLGANHSTTAHRSARMSIFIGVCIGFISAAIIVIFKGLLPMIFTTEKDIIQYSSNLLPILALFQLACSITCVGMGALRGCGRQVVGATMGFICFYVIGLPIAMSLMFLTAITLAGYWWGTAIGFIVGAVFILVYLERITDWNEEAKLARKRAGMNGFHHEPLAESNHIQLHDGPLVLDTIQAQIDWRRVVVLRTGNLIACLLVLAIGVIVSLYVQDYVQDFVTNNGTMTTEVPTL